MKTSLIYSIIQAVQTQHFASLQICTGRFQTDPYKTTSPVQTHFASQPHIFSRYCTDATFCVSSNNFKQP